MHQHGGTGPSTRRARASVANDLQNPRFRRPCLVPVAARSNDCRHRGRDAARRHARAGSAVARVTPAAARTGRPRRLARPALAGWRLPLDDLVVGRRAVAAGWRVVRRVVEAGVAPPARVASHGRDVGRGERMVEGRHLRAERRGIGVCRDRDPRSRLRARNLPAARRPPRARVAARLRAGAAPAPGGTHLRRRARRDSRATWRAT